MLIAVHNLKVRFFNLAYPMLGADCPAPGNRLTAKAGDAFPGPDAFLVTARQEIKVQVPFADVAEIDVSQSRFPGG